MNAAAKVWIKRIALAAEWQRSIVGLKTPYSDLKAEDYRMTLHVTSQFVQSQST
jgi:hypothetical protein